MADARIKMNSYFDGRVASLETRAEGKRATVGVMVPGEYEFGTGAPELVRVVSGLMEVRHPGAADFASYPAGTEFSVPGNSKFDVRISEDTSYLCIYS